MKTYQISNTASYIVDSFKYINYTQLSLEQKIKVLNSRNKPIVRQKMYSTEEISMDSHLQFIESLNHRFDCFYWYVEYNGEFIGTFNIRDVNIIKNSCESGILFDDVTLRGINLNLQFAYNSISFLLKHLHFDHINASVKLDNTFNIIVNKMIGFKEINQVNGFQHIYIDNCLFEKVNKQSINLRTYLDLIKK